MFTTYDEKDEDKEEGKQTEEQTEPDPLKTLINSKGSSEHTPTTANMPEPNHARTPRPLIILLLRENTSKLTHPPGFLFFLRTFF